MRRWGQRGVISLVLALAPATAARVDAEGATVKLRPAGHPPAAPSEWYARPRAAAWQAVDDGVSHHRRPAGRGHLRPRGGGAATVLKLDRHRLGGENVNAARAWVHARTGPGTRVRVDLIWAGAVRSTTTLGPRTRPAWHRLRAPRSLPRRQEALDDVRLRLRAVGGRRARVDAAYLRLHTVAFGFNENAFLMPADPLKPTAAETAALAAAAAGRGTVIRFGLDWRLVQGERRQQTLPPERWSWSEYDQVYAAARNAGVRLLPILIGAPGWARTGSGCDELFVDGPICPPDAAHLPDWARFVREAARRYPDSFAIEIWNEPNLRSFWALARERPDGGAYARLFNAAAAAIDAVEPGIPLVIGSLGQAPGPDDTQIEPFLEAFYDHVDRALLDDRDGLGFHPYQQAPGVPTPSWAAVDAVLSRRDPGRGLWLTEFGIKTAGTDAVSELAQGPVLLAQLRAELLRPNVEATLIHRAVDVESTDPGEQGYGVVRARAALDAPFAPKPAFCLLASFHGRPPPPGC